MTQDDRSRLAIRILQWLMLVVLLVSAASAEWKEKVLYSFQGSPDAASPVGGVVFDQQGNLYGTALGGPDGSQGTVFQLSPPVKKGGSWTEQVIYAFQGKGKNDGQIPSGGLIVDGAGNLYGVTAYGGKGGCLLLGTLVGCGTIYEMSPPKQKGGKWTETILYSFQGGKDGYYPSGTLVFDGTGNLYGATLFGGGFGICDDNIYPYCGTVFKLSPPGQQTAAWTEKVLYSFKSGTDGANPNGGLVLDSKGAVYGTTYSGGNQNCNYGSSVGCGTAFQLKPPTKEGGAWREKQLHVFDRSSSDGGNPSAGLVFDAKKHKLYGTTLNGGSGLYGTVFRLAPPSRKFRDWTETILYGFKDGDEHGIDPMAGLMFDSSGSLYGTTLGGKTHLGVVFVLRSSNHGGSWRITTLYNFAAPPDGSEPEVKLISDGSGTVYGTTHYGGTGMSCQGGCGTAFKVSPQ